MIVKSVHHKKYIHVNQDTKQSYFEQLILHQYGIHINVPKQNQVEMIRNNIKSFHFKNLH